MAKKDKSNDKKKGESSGSKFITLFIALIIVFIWLCIFALCIKLDVNGFGSGVLRPLLKDVPIVNKILPAATVEELEGENTVSYKDALNRIKELEAEIKYLKEHGTGLESDNTDKDAEIRRLKVFEDNQLKFEYRAKEFDENVVFNNNAPDISEYAKYYEGINPTTAEEIYRQVTKKLLATREVQRLADIYSVMKPGNAAAILGMMTGDLGFVADILCNMKETQSAGILAEMEPSIAAKLTKIIKFRAD